MAACRLVAPFGTVYGYYNMLRRKNFLSEEKSLATGADRPTTHRIPISLTGAVVSHRPMTVLFRRHRPLALLRRNHRIRVAAIT